MPKPIVGMRPSFFGARRISISAPRFPHLFADHKTPLFRDNRRVPLSYKK
jgi:hypothetical protein